MKFYKYSYSLLAAAALFAGGCKKSAFVELNTNPATLYNIKPEEQFLNAPITMHGQDFEQFYDNYRRIMFWMQQSTDLGGNGSVTLKTVGNFNQRYGIYFPSVGGILTDVQHIIDKMPDSVKATYAQIYAIADIPKIYYGFYVSDINGSIPYSEAFQARYGGTFTPKYENQQALYGLWDKRLKEIIGILKAAPAVKQVSLGNNDLWYRGNVALWAKAAAALRLKMAFRLMKRDATTATNIAKEVVADAANLMTSNADGWVLYADYNFTSGGNWDPTPFRAPKPTVDYMVAKGDPRLGLFYQKNNYSQANIDRAIQKKVLAPGTLETVRYVGAPISPDVASKAPVKDWFTARTVVPDSLSLDTVSLLQFRMFSPANGGGTGQSFFPVITYADELFMRAELAFAGITTENAKDLYNAGIDASISFYDKAAANAKLPDYVAVDSAHKADYIKAPGVLWDPAKGLQQIAVQEYINFFKQPNEAWALYKRTGYPNSTTPLANENIMIDGTLFNIPRRAALSAPSNTDLNRVNKQAALDDMSKDADFGQSIGDLYGRVWWDKK